MYILAPQTQYITHACKFVHKCKIFGALISYSKCSEGISVVIALILKAPMCALTPISAILAVLEKYLSLYYRTDTNKHV